MSRTRESGLWRWLRDGTRDMPLLHLQRIENSVGSGTPDVEGCLASRTFWIELKVTSLVGESMRLDLRFRDSQVEWLIRRSRAGGLCWALIQVGSGHGRHLFLVEGSRVNAFRRKSVRRSELRALSTLRSSLDYPLTAREVLAAVVKKVK